METFALPPSLRRFAAAVLGAVFYPSPAFVTAFPAAPLVCSCASFGRPFSSRCFLEDRTFCL